jgi:ABC-type Mn2+/Zn2+ transport system ATPase subunit
MADRAISLKNVWVRYNSDIVLEDITLSVEEREIVSIVGPNGSGKSTLLRAIMGRKEHYRGSIEIFGNSIQKMRDSGIFGYLPQSNNYDAGFPVNVFDVVAMSRYSRKRVVERLSRADRAIIEGALDRVGLRELSSSHFGSLSGGQKQRVLIARALALKPRIFMMD